MCQHIYASTYGETQMPTHYEVIDSQTTKVVDSFKTRDRAYRAADRKDAAYGAVRYIVRPIWPA